MLSAGVSVNSLVHVVVTVASELLSVIEVRHDVIRLLRVRQKHRLKLNVCLITFNYTLITSYLH